MAKHKKSQSKHQKPSLSVYENMDELVLVSIEKAIENIDLPIFSEDEYSKFETTEEYKEVVQAGDFQWMVKLGKLKMHIPQLFDKVYSFGTNGSIRQYVIVKDRGGSIQFICYDYLSPEDEREVKKAAELIGLQLNNEYIWSFEVNGREIELEPVYTKDGRHFATRIANGELKLNRNHSAFALPYAALRDKKYGNWASFKANANIIASDPAWRPIDVEMLLHEDPEYSSKMIEVALAVDAAMHLLQYAFTLHMISNSKKYGIVYEDGGVPGNWTVSSGSISQSGKKKGKAVHQINIDLSKKQLKKERTKRARQAARYNTEVWEVRGYKRTYKSGKEVWISPSTHKRKDDLLAGKDGKSPKKYTVKI